MPACSYEGENVVMCQQTARFLVKAARAQAEGDDSHGVPYLGQTFRDSAHAAHEWMDSPGPALAALAGRAKHLVVAGAARLEREIQCVPSRPPCHQRMRVAHTTCCCIHQGGRVAAAGLGHGALPPRVRCRGAHGVGGGQDVRRWRRRRCSGAAGPRSKRAIVA